MGRLGGGNGRGVGASRGVAREVLGQAGDEQAPQRMDGREEGAPPQASAGAGCPQPARRHAPASPASSDMPLASAWLECSSSRPPRSFARTKHCWATSSCPLPSASSPSWRHLDSLSAPAGTWGAAGCGGGGQKQRRQRGRAGRRAQPARRAVVERRGAGRGKTQRARRCRRALLGATTRPAIELGSAQGCRASLQGGW